ncbi:peroxynitrite isomerase THAP4-like [Antedon mediterranea]|uniref:peroxynitrite isomerase THAP4-like n=1 Tax=Antedon mediterranea TaxID=105859 RepID=UPI003AF40DA0
MPRCVAANCSNNHFDSVSFHKFPKDAEIRKLWTAAVSRTRLNFTPSDYSVLCSSHFTEEDFVVRFSLSVELGVSGKHSRTLKKGAVPSKFPKPATPGNLPQNPAKKRRSGVYEKRKRARVVKDILVASSSTATKQCVDVNNRYE